MQYIKVTLILLLPFTSETLLKYCERNGNMGLYGLHLEIYYKRNIFYASSLLLPVFYVLKYTYYGIALFLFSLFLFLNSCYKWREILNKNLY